MFYNASPHFWNLNIILRYHISTGINFGIVPATYKTEYTPSAHPQYQKTPPALEFLQNTGNKAKWILQNAGDQTLWFLKNKINTKVKAIRNILPKIPSGYDVSSSSSYGVPSAAYGPPHNDDVPSLPSSFVRSTAPKMPSYNIPTATLKSTEDLPSDTVVIVFEVPNLFYLFI